MNNAISAGCVALLLMLSGCQAAPLAVQAFGRNAPVAAPSESEASALIIFSADRRFESEEGLPLEGDPALCTDSGPLRVRGDGQVTDRIRVEAGKEIAVTTVIEWENTGWVKRCWPFAAFTPEAGAEYTVVNERIGGKGISVLWTGVMRQSCKVSVFKMTPSGFERIETRRPASARCQQEEE